MSENKKALITGVTGQDGAYLAELLPGKGNANQFWRMGCGDDAGRFEIRREICLVQAAGLKRKL